MKTYTFRITQPLVAFYEAKVSIKASSEEAARNKLEKMTTKQLDEIAFDWEQNTDSACADGEIEIQDLSYEEDDD